MHCPNDANRFLHTIDIMRSSKVTNLPFANFFCCCLNKNTTHKCAKTLNILFIKDIFSITVFKKVENRYHFNISGIKTITDLDSVIEWLTKTYCNKTDFRLTSYRIDNITAAFDVKRLINLNLLATNIRHSSYNPERFHALYIKNTKGTIVVFQSGKLNIVGSKSVENVLLLWKFIKEKISVAIMKKTF